MPKHNNYKGRNPPKKKQNKHKRNDEVCAYRSSSVSTNYYFGANLLDYYTPDQLRMLVSDPMMHNAELRELSLQLYSVSGIFSNTVDYMCAMPLLDKVVISHGKDKKKKTQNKEKMLSTLRKIKDKEIIRDALFRGIIEGVAFYYFETTSRPIDKKKFLSDYEVDTVLEINESKVNCAIISLPADYTKIVGSKNSDYVIAFNLEYFNTGSGEPVERKLRKYPKEIRDAYYKWEKQETGGNWIILDTDKTIVHKIRSKRDEPWGRPLVLGAIEDILYSDYFTTTKRGVLDEINNRIIVQFFPESDKKGVSSLTQSQQKQQHEAVKSGVMNRGTRSGVNFFSVASGTKISVLETNNTDLFNEKNEADLNNKIALDLGFAASLLNGVAEGASYSSQENNISLVISQVMQWIEQIETELNKCINANIIKSPNNYCEVRYLPTAYVNKKEMIDNARTLYLEGRGSLSLWAAACGISPDAFFALLDEEKENNIENKYPPHQTSYTLSSKETRDSKSDGAKGGRPITDSPADNTIRSRSNNGNDLPSPSDE